jgi:hypothetical protein
MTSSDPILVSAKSDTTERLLELYPVFVAYPAPISLDASPIRDADTILAALQSSPLDQLTADALAYYAASALTTVGSVNDYKHFLPRILYFSIRDAGYMGFDPGIVASKLRRADWNLWPMAERMAVVNFIYAAWAYDRLQNTDDRCRAWEWIAAMATLDLQFEACLELWIRQPTANAMLQLAEGRQQIKSLQRSNGIWGDVSSSQGYYILQWMMSAEVEIALVETIDAIKPSQRWQIECMLDELAELKRNQL